MENNKPVDYEGKSAKEAQSIQDLIRGMGGVVVEDEAITTEVQDNE